MTQTLEERISTSNREKLALAVQLLHEVLADDDRTDAAEGEKGRCTPVFNSRCGKCARRIMWAATENGKMAALDERPGPYALTDDGTAIFEGGLDGYGYHYDGTSEGCPAQVSVEGKGRERPISVGWQSKYDNY